jgi:hypothetical protein
MLANRTCFKKSEKTQNDNKENHRQQAKGAGGAGVAVRAEVGGESDAASNKMEGFPKNVYTHHTKISVNHTPAPLLKYASSVPHRPHLDVFLPLCYTISLL